MIYVKKKYTERCKTYERKKVSQQSGNRNKREQPQQIVLIELLVCLILMADRDPNVYGIDI